MIEQGADVAFIKTETVLENTDGNNQEPWAVNLNSQDFEILCRDGSRRPITEHENCRIAGVRTFFNNVFLLLKFRNLQQLDFNVFPC